MRVKIDGSVDALEGVREALVAAFPSGGGAVVAVKARGLGRTLTRTLVVRIVEERYEGLGAVPAGSSEPPTNGIVSGA